MQQVSQEKKKKRWGIVAFWKMTHLLPLLQRKICTWWCTLQTHCWCLKSRLHNARKSRAQRLKVSQVSAFCQLGVIIIFIIQHCSPVPRLWALPTNVHQFKWLCVCVVGHWHKFITAMYLTARHCRSMDGSI